MNSDNTVVPRCSVYRFNDTCRNLQSSKEKKRKKSFQLQPICRLANNLQILYTFLVYVRHFTPSSSLWEVKTFCGVNILCNLKITIWSRKNEFMLGYPLCYWRKSLFSGYGTLPQALWFHIVCFLKSFLNSRFSGSEIHYKI